MGRNPHRLEERNVVPRLEDTPPHQICKVNLAFDSIVVAKPEMVMGSSLDFDGSGHCQDLHLTETIFDHSHSEWFQEAPSKGAHGAHQAQKRAGFH